MRPLTAAFLASTTCFVGVASAQQSAHDSLPAGIGQPLLQASLGGGFAKTSSTPLNSTTRGYNLQAALAVRTPLEAVRLRVDGLFSDAGTTRVEAVTAGAVLSASSRWAVAPFVLAGVGGYVENGGHLTAGWNLGLGVSRGALFIESRVHAYRDALAGEPWVIPNGVVAARHSNYRYLWHPLTFGFRF